MSDIWTRARFGTDGLLPAIIQDSHSLRVLMLGYMDAEALQRTITEGRVTFWSRSREEYWRKGDTTGHYLDVVSVEADCDTDALLIRVVPHGPTCHTGTQSCFDSETVQVSA